MVFAIIPTNLSQSNYTTRLTVLAGANSGESRRNLYNWLDAVASEFLQPSVHFVYYDDRGVRVATWNIPTNEFW